MWAQDKEASCKGIWHQTLLVHIIDNQLIAVGTCTLADLITLPLMTAQSRLILQNSSSNFKSIF
jgi:hypothetical protein